MGLPPGERRESKIVLIREKQKNREEPVPRPESISSSVGKCRPPPGMGRAVGQVSARRGLAPATAGSGEQLGARGLGALGSCHSWRRTGGHGGLSAHDLVSHPLGSTTQVLAHFADEEPEVQKSHSADPKAQLQTLVLPASDRGSGLCDPLLCGPNHRGNPGLWLELGDDSSVCSPVMVSLPIPANFL